MGSGGFVSGWKAESFFRAFEDGDDVSGCAAALVRPEHCDQLPPLVAEIIQVGGEGVLVELAAHEPGGGDFEGLVSPFHGLGPFGRVAGRRSAAEETAIKDYNADIRLAAELGDNGTRDLFQSILKDEEDHIDWLETQLGQIEQMGIQIYLTEQTE